MKLVKTSILALISMITKLGSGLVINKAVSLYIGPSGLALIGQFQNVLQVLMTFSKGGINSGVTKYTAEYNNDRNTSSLREIWSTAAYITISCSVVVGFTSIVLSSKFSTLIFNTNEYNYIFVILGFNFVLFSLNQLLLSILNGLKEIWLLTTINVTQNIYGLIFTSVLIYQYGLDGALVALTTNQSIVFLSSLFRLKKHSQLSMNQFNAGFSSEEASKLGQYALMALTSACTAPLSHMYVRHFIGENVSLNGAGYWQGIWYISNMFILVMTTVLSTYFLPRFSEIKEKRILRKELISGYLFLTPIICISALIIYILRDTVISILFTSDFTEMNDLFKWQLIGSVIKAMAWLLSYIIVAKSLTKIFIISEVIFSLMFILLTIVCVNSYGLIGATYAFALNYALYFFSMVLLTRKEYI
ncbi:O-antigen translocase [Vibrio breoganii]